MLLDASTHLSVSKSTEINSEVMSQMKEWELYLRCNADILWDDDSNEVTDLEVTDLLDLEVADLVWRVAVSGMAEKERREMSQQPTQKERKVWLLKLLATQEDLNFYEHSHHIWLIWDVHIYRALIGIFVFCYMPLTRAAIGMLLPRPFDGQTYLMEVTIKNCLLLIVMTRLLGSRSVE